MEIHHSPDQEAHLAALAARVGRSADELVQEALAECEQRQTERQPQRPNHTPAEAAARILELRKGVPVLWFYEASAVPSREQNRGPSPRQRQRTSLPSCRRCGSPPFPSYPCSADERLVQQEQPAQPRGGAMLKVLAQTPAPPGRK
jgi:hypothetical protein